MFDMNNHKKRRLASWIISHFPKHACYVEPFAGSGSVLLQKAISPIEVYNDMDSSVVNFFKTLREHPDDLCKMIELTPWSREELELSREDCCENQLEWARRRYVRSFQSNSQITSHISPGWKFNHSAHGANVISLWNDTSHLMMAAERMKKVHIEHDDAIDVIQRYDTENTLFYLDPPYLNSVHSRSWANRAYQYEMTAMEHEGLAEVLHDVKGMVILSGYESELYSVLYEGWNRVMHNSRDNVGNSRNEVVWMNYVR